MSGGPSTAAVKADNLKKLGILVAQSRPWYEALGMTAERASVILGEDAYDYVSEQGSGLGRKAAELLFSAADVDALKPVCVVFKALFEAVKGAATNRDDLIDLIGYGVLIVNSIPETGGASGLSPAVKRALQDFDAEVESVVQLAGSFGITQQPTARRRFRFLRRAQEVGNHAEINKVIQGHVTQFDRILRAIGAGAAVQNVEETKAVLLFGKAASRTHLSIAAVFGAVFFVFAAVMSAHFKGIYGMVSGLRPPSLPDMAAVPAGALVLPDSYVERAAAQEVADGLTNPEEPRTPYTVVGMGGGGKSVLASAVVRKSSVREHFRGGIFWLRVGRGAKNSLLPILQGLAREMGAAPTDTPHGVPHVLDSLEQVQQHLGAVASTGTSPRLVVLDDVWEREVVDALLPLGLKVLVTTRDRSTVGVPTGCLELGDMTDEEALELLLKTSRTVGQPRDAVRTQMTKVVTLCGRLPLVLAIAGSMPVVKGKGLTAGAWGKLIEELEDVAMKMEASVEGSNSLNVVLETSFSALTFREKKAFKKTAVLAPGTVASTEMLLNLWEIEDTGGTRKEAEGLASKCLLQDVGGGGYRVHDLVLDFVKIKIKRDVKMLEKATTLQAHFLGRLDVLKGYVLKGYENPELGAGTQGLFFLDALWRSVEQLSGDPELEVASYNTSLGELESCEATTDVASSYSSVGFLFNIQGKYTEADRLYLRAIEILERVLGADHPDFAISLGIRGQLLRLQGDYAGAEPLYRRAQEILEIHLGLHDPHVATVISDRAILLSAQGKYPEAQPLFERALDINEVALGVDHPSTTASRAWMADLYETLGFFDKASPLMEEVVSASERVLGHDHPDVASALNNWAGLLESKGKYAKAEPLHERATEILETALGPDHPSVATVLNNRAGLFMKQGKYAEADPLCLRAIEIGEKTLGPDHPDLAIRLNNRAGLLEAQGKYDEAGPLYERSLAIREKVLGPDHPAVATALNNRAGLLRTQGKFSKAEPLYKRTQEIFEKSLGRDHPNVATVLNNRAVMFYEQENYRAAVPILERALKIRTKKLGDNHPETVGTRNDLEAARQKV